MEWRWRDGRLRSRLRQIHRDGRSLQEPILRENHNRLWLHGVWLLVVDSMAGMGYGFALWAGGIGIIRDTPRVLEGVSELFDLMSRCEVGIRPPSIIASGRRTLIHSFSLLAIIKHIHMHI
jgi:hypothetical protein